MRQVHFLTIRPKKALAFIRHKFGIAIYYMLKNGKTFDEKIFVQSTMKA
jgi:hypothetical protein